MVNNSFFFYLYFSFEGRHKGETILCLFNFLFYLTFNPRISLNLSHSSANKSQITRRLWNARKRRSLNHLSHSFVQYPHYVPANKCAKWFSIVHYTGCFQTGDSIRKKMNLRERRNHRIHEIRIWSTPLHKLKLLY